MQYIELDHVQSHNGQASYDQRGSDINQVSEAFHKFWAQFGLQHLYRYIEQTKKDSGKAC